MTATENPTPITDATAFRRDILTVLADLAEPNGLEIKQSLETDYNTHIPHSRVYQNLSHLVESGLVEKAQLDKRTNVYSLTEAGEVAIAEHYDWAEKRLEGEA